MKAIQVTYHGPTNTRPSRVTARAEGVKPLTLSFSYDGDSLHPYRLAAQALCERQGWTGDLVWGGLPNGDYVFCFAQSRA